MRENRPLDRELPLCRKPHLWLAIVASAALPVRAGALPTGITGFSGKTNGRICNQCHRDTRAVTPVVRFEGPTELSPGAQGSFRFVVESQSAQQIAAGFNVAASGGQLGVIVGQGEQIIGSELTHTQPKSNVEGVASWDFSWTAPAGPGDYTLFGAGNSVNLDWASVTGDRAAATTLVVVVGETATVTPSFTPTATHTISNTATRTASATQPPTPTRTPTPPSTRTPTPTGSHGPPPPCVGDCDTSKVVTVDELITAVDIALGRTSPEACPAFNGARAVSIADLVTAVANALHGCP